MANFLDFDYQEFRSKSNLFFLKGVLLQDRFIPDGSNGRGVQTTVL